MSRSLKEPDPIWPDAPRFCAGRSFPPYRFVPGLNPHPTGDPKGHPAYLPPDRWRENGIYLFGIDLYHQSYFWEAHEVWESLWHLTGKDNAEGQFYQGLIQNSAAQLKVQMGEPEGARRLSHEAWKRLKVVRDLGALDPDGRFMGLDIADFLGMMQRHYSPLWRGQKVPQGPAPRLVLLP